MGAAGRDQPSFCLMGIVVLKKKARVERNYKKTMGTTLPGEGVATASREVQLQSREAKERPRRRCWFCSFALNPCGASCRSLSRVSSAGLPPQPYLEPRRWQLPPLAEVRGALLLGPADRELPWAGPRRPMCAGG